MLCCSTKRYNKHPLAHWQEMLVVEFQFHPLEESLSGIHCNYVLWSGASRDASKDISAHCEDPGNDGQLHVTENWLNTRNENGDWEKSDFIADLCLAPLRLSAAPVQSNWEESGSHHVLALRSPGRGGQTHNTEIRLTCERLSLKSFSIISDLRWRFWCWCECGFKRLLFRLSSKGWAQASPR